MSIVLSTLVLERIDYTDNNVRIGYNNIVTPEGLISDGDAVGYSVLNLSTPVSYQKWKADASGDTSYITIENDTDSVVDYFGIASHNLSTSVASVKLQAVLGSPHLGSPTIWTDVSLTSTFTDDKVFINQFDSVTSQRFRLVVDASVGSPVTSIAPEIGVLYIGEMTIFPRSKYAGYAPPTLNRTTEVSSGYSESGSFLGRVRRNQYIENTMEMEHIPPAYYRTTLDPFVQAAETAPFFYAWRPGDYPNEVMFAWTSGDPVVNNTGGPDFVSFKISMRGIQ